MGLFCLRLGLLALRFASPETRTSAQVFFLTPLRRSSDRRRRPPERDSQAPSETGLPSTVRDATPHRCQRGTPNHRQRRDSTPLSERDSQPSSEGDCVERWDLNPCPLPSRIRRGVSLPLSNLGRYSVLVGASSRRPSPFPSPPSPFPSPPPPLPLPLSPSPPFPPPSPFPFPDPGFFSVFLFF